MAAASSPSPRTRHALALFQEGALSALWIAMVLLAAGLLAVKL